MNYKQISLVFLLGVLLGILVAFPFHQTVSYQGNYTLVTDSNYPVYAMNLLNSANKSILLVVYSAKYYANSNNKLLNVLCKASHRGVKVDVILDDELGYNNDTIKYLRSCGVNARLDSPKVRTHAKFLVIDGKIVLLGSTNWSYSSLNKNHEVDVLIKDPEIARLLTSYASGVV